MIINKHDIESGSVLKGTCTPRQVQSPQDPRACAEGVTSRIAARSNHQVKIVTCGLLCVIQELSKPCTQLNVTFMVSIVLLHSCDEIVVHDFDLHVA